MCDDVNRPGYIPGIILIDETYLFLRIIFVFFYPQKPILSLGGGYFDT